jgi:hypothetical protein
MKLSRKTRHIAGESEKPRSRKRAVWAILIAAIMAFSIAGFITLGPAGTVDFNGFMFVAQGNPQTGVVTGWTVDVDSREIAFTSHPKDVLSFNMSDAAEEMLRSAKVLILTSDPADESKDAIGLLAYDLQTILGPSGVAVVTTFTANNTFGRPIVTCANATAYEKVIHLATADANTILLEGDCLEVKATSPMNMVRMRDRLLYAYYGIIP